MKLFMMKIHLFRILKFCIQNSLGIFLSSVGMLVSISSEHLLHEIVGSVFCLLWHSFKRLLRVMVLM